MTKKHLKPQPRMTLLATFPSLPQAPELDDGLLCDVMASLAPTLRNNQRRVFQEAEGRWQILVAPSADDGYEPAFTLPGFQALNQWRRAGIEEHFPGTLLIGAQIDGLYHAFRAAVKAIPERQDIAKRLFDYAEWRERDKPLWDAGKDRDGQTRWASWYSAAASEIPEYSGALGSILADTMETALADDTGMPLLAQIAGHQIALFAYTLQLEGQPLHPGDSYPEIKDQRHLMNAVWNGQTWNGQTLPFETAQAFAKVQLSRYPHVSEAIARHAAALLNTVSRSAWHRMFQSVQNESR